MTSTLDHALASALAHGPSVHRRVLATDADGTLWTGDVGDVLFRRVMHSGDVRPGALAAIRSLLELHGLAAIAALAPADVVDAVFEAYASHRLGVEPFCDLAALALADRSIESLDALLSTAADATSPHVIAPMRAFVVAARRAGLPVHVVTGSLGRAVEATLRAADIPFDHVWGAVLETSGDAVLPRLASRAPLLEGKVRALTAADAFPPLLAAGNGDADVPFLSGAAVCVLVAPQPVLARTLGRIAAAVLDA